MTITTIASYPVTMEEYSLHYAQANAALGGTPATDLLLQGGFTKADFDTLQSDVEAAITGMEGRINDAQLGQFDRDALKQNVVARVQNFRDHVTAFLPGSRWLRALPKTPNETSSEGRFVAPLDDMADLWGKIDASAPTADFTPPLVLRDGYTLAGFQADVVAMRAAFDAVASADRELKLAREDRDRLLRDSLDRMRQYRLRVEALFADTDPIRQSLPDLYPAPGSTPDAVVASGEWDATNLVGVIQWSPSTEPTLDHYSIRSASGPTSGSVLAQVPVGVGEYHTIEGLSQPGDTASFRVYVVLTTGNERGSNIVEIVRA